MKLLLHACCGPCSIEPVRLLRESGYDVTIFYANSNIAPKEEYRRRLATLRTWAKEMRISVLEGTYEPNTWETTAGRIGDAALAQAEAHCAQADCAAAAPFILTVAQKRRQARCRACYRLRFEETAAQAAAQGFDAIGTTLSVSPYQYVDIIHEELLRAAANVGIDAVFQDYRPFYDEATRKSREAGMYRQNYCGCRLSDREAAAQRAERKAARKQAQAKKAAARAVEHAAAEAQQAARRAERRAYDTQQARKHAILKALREQQRQNTPEQKHGKP